MSGLLLQAPGVPAVLPPDRLAEVLAVVVQEVVGLLPNVDRDIGLERLANRLDGFGRTAGGGEAAAMLRAVAGSLMRLEV
ncbi:hypothetical protein [Methylobacterium brachiatum]|uniref:hypothetical protein n=1 Tax=Methylobacterium brachiatum TaxID=269660 RepID=UPI000EFBF7FD|nr:hypothetical protein [Methylobacterium brachiatum]AYO83680.1 hypothetical protein EBB05_16330 [Methylobacterium brachiatum]